MTLKEIENRIKAHLGSDWLRPVKGEKGVNAYKRAKNNLDQHFRKHGQEFGYKTAEEYKIGAYELIKNPDEVYVEKSKGKTFYIFRKGNAVVISNDDNLAIVSYYKLHRSFKEWLKGGKRDGLIKIY